jgi:hypothetical protein
MFKEDGRVIHFTAPKGNFPCNHIFGDLGFVL